MASPNPAPKNKSRAAASPSAKAQAKASGTRNPKKPSGEYKPSAQPKKSVSAKPSQAEQGSKTSAVKSEKLNSEGKPRKVVASSSGESPKASSTSKSKGSKKATAAKPSPLPGTAAKKLSPFLEKQRQKLLALKDMILDSMNGVARDSLRSRAEGNEANAFGMHQADAGSDAYDRDFALSLISKEQDSLYEIDEALKRIEAGTYGICEMSGKPIPHARLEALPFTRYTVECQAEIEKNNRYRSTRESVASLFGAAEESEDESEDELTEN